jgi:ADP-heptose:LPS heptosyltransferase
LVLHRGAGAAAKRWGTAGFADVAAWWRRRGGEVTELLGPAEADLASLPGADARRALPLPAMTELLAQAAAYVGNDSGPSHVAGALGVPGVVLFGPTDPARWRPLSSRLEVLRALPASLGPHGFTDPPAAAVIDCLERALP